MKAIVSQPWKNHLIARQKEVIAVKKSNWKRARTKLENGTGSKGTVSIAGAVLDREFERLNTIRNTPVKK